MKKRRTYKFRRIMKTASEIFAYNLKRLRKSQRITQERLAEMCDLSVTSIQNIERTSTWPSSETVSLLAKALKVPEAALFFDPDQEFHLDRIIEVLQRMQTKKLR